MFTLPLRWPQLALLRIFLKTNMRSMGRRKDRAAPALSRYRRDGDVLEQTEME